MPSRTQKEWVEENKDHVSHYKHNWYKDNIERIKQEKNRVVKCNCGNTYTHSNKAKHLKSKRPMISSSSSSED